VRGKTRSCGCLRNEQQFKHGRCETLVYRIWAEMLQRCNNHKSPSFKDYGGRGIKVCERWHSFANFYTDMGDKPAGLSIDRADNDGNYEPGNCRWADAKTQATNCRKRRTKTALAD